MDVYYTDPHISHRDINSRLDQSSVTILQKLLWIFQAYPEARRFISGGDLSNSLIDDSYYLALVNRVYARAKGQHFTVIGNHDIPYTKTMGYQRRLIGYLEHIELMQVPFAPAGDSLPQAVAGRPWPKGAMPAHAYLHDILTEPESYGFDRNTITTIFAHHFIDQPKEDLNLHIPTVKKVFPRLRHIFTGHDHIVHGTKEIHGVLVHRPGSLLRTAHRTATGGDRIRNEVFCMTIEGDYETGELETAYVSIPVALPAHRIFDSEVKIMQQATEETVAGFVESFAKTHSATTGSIQQDLAEQIAAVEEDKVRHWLENSASQIAF
jgi:hypothetical protein